MVNRLTTVLFILTCLNTNSYFFIINFNTALFYQQVIEFTDYRAHLQSYLSQRMTAIAPATTMLLGDLVGARLIAHSG